MRWDEERLAAYQAKRGKDTFHRLIESKGFNPTEDVEHMAVARYLELLGLLFIHVPSEGKRKPSTGAKLKAMGSPKGFPDFQIFDAPPLHPTAKGVCVELKRVKGGKVSDEQRGWLAALEQRGWIVAVSEGANEALQFLRSLGWAIGETGRKG